MLIRIFYDYSEYSLKITKKIITLKQKLLKKYYKLNE